MLLANKGDYIARTKKRKNARTKKRKNEKTKKRKNARTKKRKNAKTKERKNEKSKGAAFDAGFPTIIMENGFTPLSKPHGEQFEACARGQLLMLAPWEHHNEKRKVTAEQCQQMNLMTQEICKLLAAR